MPVDTHEEFAARLLGLPAKTTYTGRRVARDYSFAIWIARRYGYRYPDIHRAWSNQTSLTGSGQGHVLEFWRDDDPAARRRADWMRNPNGDPSLPPPIAWTAHGGPGFHPPGWFPSVRLLITAEAEEELRALDQAVAQTLRLHWFNGIPDNPPPARPPGPLPPPPPDTIAYPDEERPR